MRPPGYSGVDFIGYGRVLGEMVSLGLCPPTAQQQPAALASVAILESDVSWGDKGVVLSSPPGRAAQQPSDAMERVHTAAADGPVAVAAADAGATTSAPSAALAASAVTAASASPPAAATAAAAASPTTASVTASAASTASAAPPSARPAVTDSAQAPDAEGEADNAHFGLGSLDDD
jgi:hypothetical protein